MTKLLQTLFDGVAVGSLYALIALGYTMVYGILQFINFAHSDIFMTGAWIAYVVSAAAGWAVIGADAPPLWRGVDSRAWPPPGGGRRLELPLLTPSRYGHPF